MITFIFYFHSNRIHQISLPSPTEKKQANKQIVYGIFMLNRRYAPNINQCGKVDNSTFHPANKSKCECVCAREKRDEHILWLVYLNVKTKALKSETWQTKRELIIENGSRIKFKTEPKRCK